MAEREDIEKVLAGLRRQTEKAEAEADSARERLARIAAGLVPLADLNADEIEGAADDLAAAARRYQVLTEVAASVRSLLF
jgi:hypothetical protein